MQDAVLERVPDFDFSQFTFETNGMTYLHDKNDATKEIGKQFYFRIYYQDILLDPEQYDLHIQQYYDGQFETNADFLTANMQNKLVESVAAPRIAESDAVSAAREYAASLQPFHRIVISVAARNCWQQYPIREKVKQLRDVS